MKIFSLAITDNGEIKIAGDLDLIQVKQIIEAILLQQAFQQGIIKGKEEIREVKDASKQN